MGMSCKTARTKVQKMIDRHQDGPKTPKEEYALAHIASCTDESCRNLYENWKNYLKPTLEYEISRLILQLEEAREKKEELLIKVDTEITALQTRLETALALHAQCWPDNPITE